MFYYKSITNWFRVHSHAIISVHVRAEMKIIEKSITSTKIYAILSWISNFTNTMAKIFTATELARNWIFVFEQIYMYYSKEMHNKQIRYLR